MEGHGYTIEYDKDVIGDYVRRFGAVRAKLRSQLAKAGLTAAEKRQLEALQADLSLAEARLAAFIRDLARDPSRALEPPPIELRGPEGERILEFRPQAAYRGRPARSVTARAWVSEARKTVLVYVIRMDIPGEGGRP